MVQLIDFEQLNVVKYKEEEVKIIDIAIEEEGLLNYSSKELYDKIFAVVQEKMAAQITLNDKLYFKLTITDSTITDVEYSIMYFICANIIAANLLVGKMREREPRLKIPTTISTNGLFSLVWLRRMVNEQMVCNIVGGVVKINDKERGIV
jgi:hypothetical protein